MPNHSPTLDEISRELSQNRPAVAEHMVRSYLATNSPDIQSGLILLGVCLQHQGKIQQSAAVFKELTERWPAATLHWKNFGSILRQAGDSVGAEYAYRRSLALRADDSEALQNLGYIYYDRFDFAAARKFFLAAVEADSAAILARIYGAYACCECTDMDSAEQLVAPWQTWRLIELEHQLLLAVVMTRIENLNAAEQILLEALRDTTEKPRVQVRLLMLYERLNRISEAQRLLAELPAPESIHDPDLRREVTNAFAAMAARESDYRKASALLEPLADIAQLDADFFFALARVRDKLLATDQAMAALHRAHEAQLRKVALLAPDLLTSDAEPLTTGLDPVSAEAHDLWMSMPSPTSQQSPVFIMGFPRSGTTMLEQMLDTLPELQAMDEQPFFRNVEERMNRFGLSYPHDLYRLTAVQCDELRAVYWGLVKRKVTLGSGQQLVDKNPLNMLRLPLINRLFPQARIIFTLRHPCDVVLSCYMQSFSAPSFMLLCSSLERLGKGYSNAMLGWLQNVSVLKPALLTLRYEDLLADFSTRSQTIAEFIGVKDASPMSRFHEHARAKGYIATPSYAQVTEPLHRRAIGRWHRYRRYLAPVLPLLRPFLERWDYAD